MTKTKKKKEKIEGTHGSGRVACPSCRTNAEEIPPPEELSGRRAVRVHLIDPLVSDGLKRSPRTKLADHEATLKKLIEKLAYMSPDGLDRLRPMVRGMAEGTSLDNWPSLATIVNLAANIEAPPDKSDQILHGWLHSRVGPGIRRAGTLMATRAYIKKFRRPPVTDGKVSSYLIERIQDKQRQIDRDVMDAREAVARGEASPSQAKWLEDHDHCLAQMEAIVADGERHRAEKVQNE